MTQFYNRLQRELQEIRDQVNEQVTGAAWYQGNIAFNDALNHFWGDGWFNNQVHEQVEDDI